MQVHDLYKQNTKECAYEFILNQDEENSSIKCVRPIPARIKNELSVYDVKVWSNKPLLACYCMMHEQCVL